MPLISIEEAVSFGLIEDQHFLIAACLTEKKIFLQDVEELHSKSEEETNLENLIHRLEEIEEKLSQDISIEINSVPAFAE